MKKLILLLALPILGLFQANAQGQCQAYYFNNSAQCPTVNFYDASYTDSLNGDQVVSWLWDFGDGNTSSLPNPTNTYGANGLYLTCLTIVTSQGCTSTYCDSIDVNCLGQQGNCQAGFQYMFDSICPTVMFSDYSTASAGVVEWYWDFGDGNTSTSMNPYHTYSSNGTYLVCLTTVAADSCYSTYCDTLNINCLGQQGNCQAAFQYTFDSICPTVMFSDYSTASAGVVEWYWDFGDGNTSTSMNPYHTYSSNGTYLVCLTIVAADSCYSTYCDTLSINCLGQQGNCQAAFQYTFDSICPTVMFSDYSTASAGVVEWYWDFGDGNTSTSMNPYHTYSSNGTYLVCLTTVAADSCYSTYCDTLNINCLGQQGNCQAAFQYTFDSICPTVMFSDYSTASAGVVEWYWDFGDGNTSTSMNPYHTYSSNGTYLVCLTIVAADSCYSTYCDTLNINCLGQQGNCQSAFQFLSDSLGCGNYQFYDYSSASAGIVQWYWDFGDGTTSAQANPYHVFANNGTYVICLTVVGADSCVNTSCQTIVVNCGGQQGCQASFQSIIDSIGCPSMDFYDGSTASAGIVEWYWDFGDGSTSNATNPSHTFSTNGLHSVCLTIVGADSCTSTYCETVIVDCILTLEENVLENSVVYPNPANNLLNLRLDQSRAIDYRIVGLNGSVYLMGSKQAMSEHSFDIRTLSQGMYLLEVYSEGSREIIRFTKE